MALDRTNPVTTVTSSTLPTGASTSANQATEISSLGSIDTKLTSQATAAKQDTIITSVGSIDTKLSSQATAANQTAEATLIGAVTETAPASDVASSGLNGRLQRVAQRITSLIALLPAALGAGGGLKVDGSGTALPVSGTVTANAGTGTLAVSGPVTDTQLRASAVPVSLATLPALVAGTANIGDVDVLTLPALAAGTNNIGDVDVLTLPALPAGGNNIGDVDVLTQPARVKTSDSISVAADTASIMNGLTALTPKFATIAAASSGDNTLVALVGGKKIRVLAYNFMANGTVNAKFKSGGGTDLTGLKYLLANTGLVAPFNPVGWFETVSGEALLINLSAAIAVGGELVYVEV